MKASFVLHLIHHAHIVYPERIPRRTDISPAMAGRELQLEVRGTIRDGTPAYLLNRHALALAVHGVSLLHLQAHLVGVIIRMIRDVAVEDGIGGIVLPIWRCLVIAHHHRAYAFGIDIPVFVFPTLLEIKVDFGEIASLHILDPAETGSTDTVGTV